MSRKQSSTKWTTHFEFRGRILCLLTRVQRRESLVFSAEIFQACAVLFGFSSFRVKSSQIVTSRYKFPLILPTTTHSDCEVFHAHHTNALESLEFRALFSPSLLLVLFVERVLLLARRQRRENFIRLREKEIDPQKEEEKIRGNRAQKHLLFFFVSTRQFKVALAHQSIRIAPLRV